MSELLGEKTPPKTGSDVTSQSSTLWGQLEAIFAKLRTDPSSITAEEARFLSENVTASDERAVRIIPVVNI